MHGYIKENACVAQQSIAFSNPFGMTAKRLGRASHHSPEPGHGHVLAALGLEPLLDLGLRLGEGSGGALALPLLAAALAILDEMATFETAGVTDAGR